MSTQSIAGKFSASVTVLLMLFTQVQRLKQACNGASAVPAAGEARTRTDAAPNL